MRKSSQSTQRWSYELNIEGKQVVAVNSDKPLPKDNVRLILALVDGGTTGSFTLNLRITRTIPGSFGRTQPQSLPLGAQGR